MKIVFAGTPDFAASVFNAILGSRHQVIAAYTQPDRPSGRGRKLAASPVKQLALEHSIPVYQPVNFKDPADVAALAALQPDIMVVVAYGLLLPQAVLAIPALGCINVHASLLPRWRGAAPIQRAIAAGDRETGITIMQMDAGLDTGDMLLKTTTPIDPDENGGSLHDRLATLGADACVQALEQLAAGTVKAEPQDDTLASYAHKLTKEEGNLDWSQPTRQLHDKIRGLSPWPVAYSQLHDKTLRIHAARIHSSSKSSQETPGQIISADKNGIVVATGDGSLALTRLQLPGGKALTAAELLNSKRELLLPGTHLGS
ncbi:MAG: methionyl-tRNA formyltransferase [Gammaproteobacteria bacterium]|nr:MAG: methionyl-tRNA formyltransferase [Gammaproteobacteria bacterium]